jgi:hypothetical protein
MTKRTVEMEDNLDETVDSVKEEIRDNFIEYLRENPDCEEFDDYYQDKGCDAVHEISDSNTPIYTKEIDGLYYLYSDEFDEAYKNAGIGNGTEDNHQQVAIYCYLSEQGFNYLGELQDEFEEWVSNKQLPENPADDGSIAVESTVEDFIKALEG